jgi:hypothetical protein
MYQIITPHPINIDNYISIKNNCLIKGNLLGLTLPIHKYSAAYKILLYPFVHLNLRRA